MPSLKEILPKLNAAVSKFILHDQASAKELLVLIGTFDFFASVAQKPKDYILELSLLEVPFDTKQRL